MWWLRSFLSQPVLAGLDADPAGVPPSIVAAGLRLGDRLLGQGHGCHLEAVIADLVLAVASKTIEGQQASTAETRFVSELDGPGAEIAQIAGEGDVGETPIAGATMPFLRQMFR
jgi:hypothetical protein